MWGYRCSLKVEIPILFIDLQGNRNPARPPRKPHKYNSLAEVDTRNLPPEFTPRYDCEIRLEFDAKKRVQLTPGSWKLRLIGRQFWPSCPYLRGSAGGSGTAMCPG